MLATLAVTRLYAPDEVASVQLLINLVSYWSLLSTLRIEIAVLSARGPDEVFDINLVAGGCSLAFSILLWPVLQGLSKAHVLGFQVLPAWAPPAAAIYALLFSAFNIARVNAVREAQFTAVSRATIGRSVANGLVRVGGGLVRADLRMLVAAEIVASISSLYQLIGRKTFDLARAIRAFGPMTFRRVFASTKAFWAVDLPTTAIDSLTPMLAVPFVLTLYGPTAAGLFVLAQRLTALPVAQIGVATGDVFQMEYARLSREGLHEEARRAVRSFAFKLTLASLPAFGLLALVAPFVFGPIFGPSWAGAGLICSTLAPFYAAGLIVSPLSRIFSVNRLTHRRLIYAVVTISAEAALFSAFYFLKLNKIYSLYYYIIGMTVVHLICYAFYAILIQTGARVAAIDATPNRAGS
jgi:O-antigen/teichoic acid export membrane protein